MRAAFGFDALGVVVGDIGDTLGAANQIVDRVLVGCSAGDAWVCA